MNRWTIVPCAVLALALGVVGVAAEQGKGRGKGNAKSARIYAPYHKLELTEDQKAQIVTIQLEYAAKIDAIRAEECSRIEPLLTAEQKAQLAKQEDDSKQRRKSGRGNDDEEKGRGD